MNDIIQKNYFLHKSEIDNSYAQNSIIFGPMNTNRIEERVREYKYLQEDFKWDFNDANEYYYKAYQRCLHLK